MPDLRDLRLEQRQALAAEAERLARSGVAAPEIRARLGLSYGTYSRWARLFGFRQCDLYPERKQACAPPKHPPGPSEVNTGRRFLGLPPGPEDGRLVSGAAHPAWRGGEAAWRQRDLDKRSRQRRSAVQEVEALGKPRAIMIEVEKAQAAGDLTRVDALLAAWKASQRRQRDFAALEQAAYEAETFRTRDEMTTEELFEDLKRLTGRHDLVLVNSEED